MFQVRLQIKLFLVTHWRMLHHQIKTYLFRQEYTQRLSELITRLTEYN